MPDFRVDSIPFDELLAQLRRNEFSCTKLILTSNQLTTVNERQILEFCEALEQNNTLTDLEIASGNSMKAQFVVVFLRAIQNNRTITNLALDKEHGSEIVSKETFETIQAILDRNRNFALEKPIHPKRVVLSHEASSHSPAKLAFIAAERGELDILHTLVLDNLDLMHKVDFINKSLLHVAAKFGRVDCVKLLLQMGAEVDYNPPGAFIWDQVGTALHEAVRESNIVIARLLLNAGASVSSRRNGFSPLHDVKNLEVAQLLVAYGADVRAICGDETKADISRGNTVLHSVLFMKSPPTDLLRFLIEKGAPVNRTNSHGEIPLHNVVRNIYQSEKGMRERMNVLLRAGANPLIADCKGRIPLALAQLVKFEWTKIIAAATRDYLRIRNAGLSMAQGVRSGDGFFSRLPNELLLEIAEYAVDSRCLDEETIKTVATNNLGRP